MDGSEEYGAERGCGDAWFYKRSSAGKAREMPGMDFCFKQQHIWPTARAKRPSECAVCAGLHRVSDGQWCDGFAKGAGHPLRGKSSRSKRTFNPYLPLPQELPDTVLIRNVSAKRRAYLLKIADDLLCLVSRRGIWPTAPSTRVLEAHRHRMQTHVLQRAIIVVNHFCDYRLPVLAIGRKPCRVVLRTLAEIVTWQ